MHPTADTTALMYVSGSGRRAMLGVRLLRMSNMKDVDKLLKKMLPLKAGFILLA